MNRSRHYLRQWQENPVSELLAGAVATFALIPAAAYGTITLSDVL